jgi:hypothetical protein
MGEGLYGNPGKKRIYQVCRITLERKIMTDRTETRNVLFSAMITSSAYLAMHKAVENGYVEPDIP